MKILKFGKKKKVPDRLPDLISEEIEKESMQELNNLLNDKKKINTSEKEDKVKRDAEVKKREAQFVEKLIKNIENTSNRKMGSKEGKSFFDELQEKIKNEFNNLEGFSSLSKGNLSSNNFVEDMKNYWIKEKNKSYFDELSGEIEKEVDKKIFEMKKLEKSWQEIYFELAEKEELIKKEEEELKKLLRKLSKIYKERKGALEDGKEKTKDK